MNFFRKSFAKYRTEIIITIVALVLRLLYLWWSVHFAGGDVVQAVRGADGYFVIAQNIVAGNGFSSSLEAPYELNSFRPPLQPYFIAWAYQLFNSYLGAILIQLLLSCAIPVLGMKIAEKVFESRKIGIITGAMLALEPVAVLFAGVFYAETLFMFFLYISLYLIVKFFREGKRSALIVSAIFLGLSSLAKPISEYVAIIIALALVWKESKVSSRLPLQMGLKNAGIFVAVFCLVISPWLYRNYQAFGVVTLSGQKDAAIYAVLGPSVLAFHNNTTFQVEYEKFLNSGVKDVNKTNISESATYLNEATKIFAAHPLALAAVIGNTAASFFTHDGMLDVLRHVGIRPTEYFGKPAMLVAFTEPGKFIKQMAAEATRPTGLVIIARLFWILATFLAFVGVIRYLSGSIRKAEGVVLIATVGYFMLATLTIGLAVNSRYRLPVEPIILAFAVYGFYGIRKFFKKAPIPKPGEVKTNYKKLSIVIPVYNEERTLEELVRRVKAVDLGPIEKEIIIVDNNSKDRSLEIARSIPGVRVLTEPIAGRGIALITGFKHATGDIYIFQDADLEYDPQDHKAMIKPILDGQVELVLGVRADGRRKDRDKITYFLAHLGNFTMTRAMNILYWNKAKEYTGCYKAFTAKLWHSIPVDSIDFDLDQEIIAKILKRGYRTVDVPIRYFPRSYAEGKKINWKHGFMMLWAIIKYRFVD